MPTVLKRMTLAGRSFQPGETISEEFWQADLRERTRRVLIDNRFVTFGHRKAPSAPPTPAVAIGADPIKRKRGRPRKVRPEE